MQSGGKSIVLLAYSWNLLSPNEQWCLRPSVSNTTLELSGNVMNSGVSSAVVKSQSMGQDPVNLI